MDLKLPPIPVWSEVAQAYLAKAKLKDIIDCGGVGNVIFPDKTRFSIRYNGTNIVISLVKKAWSQEFLFGVLRDTDEASDPIGIVCLKTGASGKTVYFYDGAAVLPDAFRSPAFRKEIHELHVRNVAVASLLRRPGVPWESKAVSLADLEAVGPGDNREAKIILDAAASKEARRKARAMVEAQRELRAKARLQRQREHEEHISQRVAADPLGTDTGIMEAQIARKLPPIVAASVEAFREGGSALEGLELRMFPERMKRAAVEDHLRLDVRALNRRGLLVEGRLSFVDLYWPSSTADINRVQLAIDLRGKSTSVRIAFDRDGVQVIQESSIWFKPIGGRRRPIWLCGQTGEYAEVLAYRDGGFARPPFLNLTYRSQLG